MIDLGKLKAVLIDYKRDFASQQWENERYKWEAVKHFQDYWDINDPNFTEMFTKAIEKTDNLLASMNNFPRGMIQNFASADPEATRAMFIDLFDETKDFVERVEKFMSDAEALRVKYDDGTWKQHYQNPNSISTYLWLRYPDKYYIYKYSECRIVAKELGSDFIPKKGASSVNLVGGFNLYNEICKQLAADAEMVRLLQSVLTDNCYPDKALKTLTIGVAFYISRFYSKKSTQNITNDWFPKDYSPNVTTETWISLLADETVFTTNSLEIMKRIKDYGGMATCTQLSLKYGGTKNFYNVGSSSLARRVADKTGCPVLATNNENSKWWPILYLGRYADKNTEGSYVWKLRDELNEALDQFDLSKISLYANRTPSIWKISHGTEWFTEVERKNFEEKHVILVDKDTKAKATSKVSQGESFMSSMKKGDYFYLCYGNSIRLLGRIKTDEVVLNPEKQNGWYQREYTVVAKSKDYSPYRNTQKWWTPNDNSTCIMIDEADKLLFEELILKPYFDMALSSLLSNRTETIETYSKEEFLEEVYMTGERFDTLISLLKNKQNLILQGAPGVGKTFVARRLAYAVMKEKDDNRIEFIQFHQSFSYEDFIMGYKPQGEGFELQNGIFYRFCEKAVNIPDKPFFFIIDEINRGNMSKIFGELLMLIEKDYRGTKATLAYNGMPFTVPKNLYIIGMMNTADRSLAMIDYALRRRFCFFEMEPGFNSDGFKAYQAAFDNDTFNTLVERIKELNKEITTDSSLGKGFCIGHSYFCGQNECSDEWMMEIVEYDIIPMLSEYWFDEPTKLQRWENILRGVFND